MARKKLTSQQENWLFLHFPDKTNKELAEKLTEMIKNLTKIIKNSSFNKIFSLFFHLFQLICLSLHMI